VSFSNFEASDDAIANMNGQYLMNKDVSVQYAYKKDGKGERHGDQAERILAAQARKHNVQPTAQQLPPQLFGMATPATPGGMVDIDPSRALNTVPGDGGAYMNGRGGMSNGTYQSVPPSMQQRPPPHLSQPLPPPPSGLPSRPPLSNAGYGGPQSLAPPGFGAPPPGFAPPGFSAPPAQGRGVGTPEGPPGGFPPGFQSQPYGR
jgi:splicing factor 3B subunit 4